MKIECNYMEFNLDVNNKGSYVVRFRGKRRNLSATIIRGGNILHRYTSIQGGLACKTAAIYLLREFLAIKTQ